MSRNLVVKRDYNRLRSILLKEPYDNRTLCIFLRLIVKIKHFSTFIVVKILLDTSLFFGYYFMVFSVVLGPVDFKSFSFNMLFWFALC